MEFKPRQFKRIGIRYYIVYVKSIILIIIVLYITAVKYHEANSDNQYQQFPFKLRKRRHRPEIML